MQNYYDATALISFFPQEAILFSSFLIKSRGKLEKVLLKNGESGDEKTSNSDRWDKIEVSLLKTELSKNRKRINLPRVYIN